IHKGIAELVPSETRNLRVCFGFASQPFSLLAMTAWTAILIWKPSTRHARRDVRRAGGLLRRIRSNELGMPAEMSQRDPFGMRRAG
ncbi:MAG: hypothetical protein COZ37_02060, partial [bacterium (Candidatus Ratteibacteria) CG_4_10_14_3_um_filter_41_18]